jgi:hypothetical protein
MVLGVWIPSPTEDPIAWFLGGADRPESNAVFWAYSIKVYREVLAMLGFTIVSSESYEFRHTSGLLPRTAIVAKRL